MKRTGSKYALGIIFNFVWMFTLYRICIFLAEKNSVILLYMICAAVYLTAATVLLALYGILSSRVGSEEEKQRFKPLLMWAFPIVVTLIIDAIDLLFLDGIINFFS